MQVHPCSQSLLLVHCGVGVKHMPFMQMAGAVQSVLSAQPLPGFVQAPAMQTSGAVQAESDVQAPLGGTHAFATHSQVAGQSPLMLQVPGTHAPVMQVDPEAQSLSLLQTAVPLGTHASPPSTAAQVNPLLQGDVAEGEQLWKQYEPEDVYEQTDPLGQPPAQEATQTPPCALIRQSLELQPALLVQDAPMAAGAPASGPPVPGAGQAVSSRATAMGADRRRRSIGSPRKKDRTRYARRPGCVQPNKSVPRRRFAERRAKTASSHGFALCCSAPSGGWQTDAARQLCTGFVRRKGPLIR
jgi:hypothetical protein